MTKELLEKVVKAKKINIKNYDSVLAYVNENYTKVFIYFGNAEVVGGCKKVYNQIEVKLSVCAILKREEEMPDEYATHGWTYIDYIK